MNEYGRRTKRLPAPPHVVWADLCAARSESTRAWLALLPDEVPPAILEGEEPSRLVWSSLWPARPDDRVVLELAAHGAETALTFSLEASDDWPDDEMVHHVRYRMNRLLYDDLRQSYDQ